MAQHVMVVDDERSIATTLSLILQASGYEVATANSGPAALRLAESFVPDVLITDFAMPGMTGLEMAIELNQRFPVCRVIVFTGQPKVSQPEQARIPKYRLLFKPVPPEEFIRAIRSTHPYDGLLPLSRKPEALCVDDVESHRYSIARFLRNAGFQVAEAATGRAGIDLATKQPDVIVLDVGLPDINGIDVCRLLKKNPETAEIPVVHVTSSHFDEDARDEALRTGAYDYLTAPYDLDQLLARVRSAAQARFLQAPQVKGRRLA